MNVKEIELLKKSRLTKRSNKNEGLPIKHINVRHEDTTSEYNLNEIFDKLADFEDFEEQKMLLMIPCKIGDIFKLF